jgi:hypothetical protein
VYGRAKALPFRKIPFINSNVRTFRVPQTNTSPAPELTQMKRILALLLCWTRPNLGFILRVFKIDLNVSIARTARFSLPKRKGLPTDPQTSGFVTPSHQTSGSATPSRKARLLSEGQGFSPAVRIGKKSRGQEYK